MQDQARVVVVGAGIVGCSVAYHLAQLGWREIVVLEQGPLFETGGSTSPAPGHVYAVWFDVLLGDDRSAWNPNLLVDPRVIQYWDSDRTLGTWFPRQEVYKPMIFGPLAWDIFFLYGPEAVWEDVPAPLVTSGSTIIAKRDRLRSGISQYLMSADDGQG